MRILVINPNTTRSMTEKIGDAARAVAAPGTEIVAVNPADGPASIEGYYDEAFSLPGLLAEMTKGRKAGFDGYVLACFDDSGLDAARTVVDAPVIGICEAATRFAAMLGGGFSVVTTLKRSVPVIEHLMIRYGMERHCRKVRGSDIPVLAFEDPCSNARQTLTTEMRRAIDEDGAEALILGCAGMADLANQLSEELGVPVIDGVGAAVKMVEGAIALGLKTSKAGGYAWPLAKTYAGRFSNDAPRD